MMTGNANLDAGKKTDGDASAKTENMNAGT